MTDKELQQKVLERDGHRCVCCHRHTTAAPHHIIYKSSGGKDTADNLATVCMDCHERIHHTSIKSLVHFLVGDLGPKRALRCLLQDLIKDRK